MAWFHFFVDNKEQLGIASFGISVTTLEEVFIKVGEGSDKTVDDMYVTMQAFSYNCIMT